MANLAIVAIPTADDHVWKISSEKIPHMTLLFLGEQSDNPNIEHIKEFVEHAAKTVLNRFGLSVDRRGELGDSKADVLFLENHPRQSISRFREFLLKDRYILEAFNSVEQFDEWNPHLTLGYPATPAWPDTRAYPGLHWIRFDKIAVWDEDFAGLEILLEDDDRGPYSVGWSEKSVSFLAHYGVKGQKWGVRRKNRGGSSSTDTKGRAFVKGKTKQVSDEELRKRINRLEMDQKYKTLTAKPKSKGKAFVKEVLATSAKSIATTQVTKLGNAAVGAAFASAAAKAAPGSTGKLFLEAMALTGKKKK